MKVRIFLDVDDVVLAWHEAYIKKYNLPMPTDWVPYDEIKGHLEELQQDRLFWLTLRPKHVPNFNPTGYVSARGVPVQWTKDVMKLRKIPGRSKIRHVKWNESKMEVLKSVGCDIFVDDRYATFKECHENGIFCLLMDTPQNQHHETDLRIFDLKLKTIMKKYNQWQKSI